MEFEQQAVSDSAHEGRVATFILTDHPVIGHRAYYSSPVVNWRPESLHVTLDRQWKPGSGWSNWSLRMSVRGRLVKKDGTYGQRRISEARKLEDLPGDLATAVRRLVPPGSVTDE